MLNHICIMGRLTRDPELRYTQNQKPVCNFSIACERDRAIDDVRPTDFVECVAWNGTGEFVNRYFSKGQMIIVSGRLQMHKYEDRNGQQRTAHEINVSEAYFGEAKRDER